jgi:hypothetical protein
MGDLNSIWEKVLKATQKRVRAASIDAFISRETKGQITNLEGLKTALSVQDKAPSEAEAAGRGLVQGLTLGHQDEIAGGVWGHLPEFLGGDPKGYAHARDAERSNNEAAKQAHPYLYGGAELAGGLAPGALIGAAAPEIAGGAVGTVLKGALAGAGIGAVAGEGGSTENGLNAIPDASNGAEMGAAIGAVAPVVLAPAFKLIGTIIDVLQPAAKQALVRLARVAPVDVADQVAKLAQDTKAPVTLADVSPELADELRRVANGNPTVRAAANEFLNARQSGQSERMASSLEANSGSGGHINLPEVEAAAKTSMRSAADKMYQPLEEKYDQIEHPQVDAALQQPEIRDAYRMVKPDSREIKLWNDSNEPDPQTGQKPPMPPSFRRLQETRRNLAQTSQKAFAQGDGLDGQKFGAAKQTLEDAMHDAMPELPAIDNNYYTSKVLLSSFGDGAESAHAPADVLKFNLDRAAKRGGPNAVSAFRMGWFNKWATDLRQPLTNANVAAKIAQMGPEAQQSFKMMFADENDLQRFLRTAKAESIMARTRAMAQGNSSTAAQLAGMLGGGQSIPTTGPGIMARIGSAAMTGTRAAADEPTGNMLLQHGAPLNRTMDLIEKLRQGQAWRQQAGRAAPGAVAGGVTSLFGDQ